MNMNFKYKKIYSWLFCILLSGFAFSEGDVITKTATAAANWLKIETGARGIGMGGSQTASGRGVSAIPFNPAALGFINKTETYYSKSYYLIDISHNVIAYGKPISTTDFVAFHMFYLNSGEIPITTEDHSEGTGEMYSVINLALRGTYSKLLTDRLKFGISIKYIREQIFTASMQSFAIDLGSIFETGIYGFFFGMSVSNFGPEVQFHGEGLDSDSENDEAYSTDKYPIPLSLRIGLENEIIGANSSFIKSIDHSFILSADAIKSIDYPVYLSVGSEYSWKNIASLRIGTHLGHDTAGLSLGGGIAIHSGVNIVIVDYAYVDYGILENTHQFGLSFKF